MITCYPTKWEAYDVPDDDLLFSVEMVDADACHVTIKSVVDVETWPAISDAILRCLQDSKAGVTEKPTMETPKRKSRRGHTDREEASMAVHVDALTAPVGDLIYDVLRKHHRAVLEGVKELHERTTKAESERDALREALRELVGLSVPVDRARITASRNKIIERAQRLLGKGAG